MEHISQLAPYIVLIVIILFIAAGIRIANEHERFVVNVLGRYAGIKGPGLLLKWPGSATKWHRISLGEEAVYLGDNLVKIRDAVFPVKGADTCAINAKVHIASFTSGHIHVTRD